MNLAVFLIRLLFETLLIRITSSQVALVVKNPPANAGNIRNAGSIPGLGRSPEEGMATHSSILAWRIPGQRSLVGYSPRGRKASDTTE